MPTFNDNQPNRQFHSPRKLLSDIAPCVQSLDPSNPAYTAMTELWARLVEKRPSYKRRVPSGHYNTSKSRLDRAIAAALDARPNVGNAEPMPEDEFEAQLLRLPTATPEQLAISARIKINSNANGDGNE